MSALTIETEFLTCRDCLLSKPTSQFRRRRREGSALTYQCSRCHNESERKRQRRARRLRKDRRLTRAAREIAVDDCGPDRVRALALRLMRHFGGPSGLAKRMQEVVQRHPDSISTGYIMLATLRLSVAGNDLPEPETLSGDRRQQLAREMIGWILDNPTVASDCLRELGFTVFPPVDTAETSAPLLTAH